MTRATWVPLELGHPSLNMDNLNLELDILMVDNDMDLLVEIDYNKRTEQ
jgi:hypothetical protein